MGLGIIYNMCNFSLPNTIYEEVNCEELIAKFDSECANVSVKTDQAEVTVSVAKGLAMYDPDRDTQFADVFNRADNAMYENKRCMKAVLA